MLRESSLNYKHTHKIDTFLKSLKGHLDGLALQNVTASHGIHRFAAVTLYNQAKEVRVIPQVDFLTL